MRRLFRQRARAGLATALIVGLSPAPRETEGAGGRRPALRRARLARRSEDERVRRAGRRARDRRDGVVTIRGLGVTNVEDPLPVNDHTVFPIASISKTFAATAMMRLVEQGKVDLRAPVRNYLPDFTRARRGGEPRRDRLASAHALGGWEGQVSGPERGEDTLRELRRDGDPRSDAGRAAGRGVELQQRRLQRRRAASSKSVTGTSDQSRHSRSRVPAARPRARRHDRRRVHRPSLRRRPRQRATATATLQRPFSPSVSVTAGGVGLCIDRSAGLRELPHGRRHRARTASGCSTRASLELMRTPQLHKQGTDDDIGIAWHLRHVGPIRTCRARRHARRAHPAARDRARAQLRDRDPDQREHRLAADPGRRARGAEDVPRRDVRAATRRSRIAGWSRRCRTASRSRAARSGAVRRHVPAADERGTSVRVEGGKLFVQERPNDGEPRPEMPIAFFGPDRAVVTDGTDRGQSIEFVRDDGGSVNWIRVVGRVAVAQAGRPVAPWSAGRQADGLRRSAFGPADDRASGLPDQRTTGLADYRTTGAAATVW